MTDQFAADPAAILKVAKTVNMALSLSTVKLRASAIKNLEAPPAVAELLEEIFRLGWLEGATAAAVINAGVLQATHEKHGCGGGIHSLLTLSSASVGAMQTLWEEAHAQAAEGAFIREFDKNSGGQK